MMDTCEECGDDPFVNPKIFDNGSKREGEDKSFYDAGGNFHFHSTTKVTKYYSCSNGHRWEVIQENKTCPSCGDHWWQNEDAAGV